MQLEPDEQPNDVPADVLVSVLLTTYQHAPFIEQAIESVLRQKTTFPFELCIGEDDSTDGTREICRRYAALHPTRIRLFLRHEADKVYVGGAKTGKYNTRMTLRACRGRFVAELEGDDFWIHEGKLQLQADWLQADAQAAVCATQALNWGFKPVAPAPPAFRPGAVGPAPHRTLITAADVIREGVIVNTCTLMFRRDAYPEPPAWARTIISGDWAMLVSLLQDGRHCRVLPDVTAVYRMHSRGLWENRPGAQHSWSENHHRCLLAYSPVAAAPLRALLARQRAFCALKLWMREPVRERWRSWWSEPLPARAWSLLLAAENRIRRTGVSLWVGLLGLTGRTIAADVLMELGNRQVVSRPAPPRA